MNSIEGLLLRHDGRVVFCRGPITGQQLYTGYVETFLSTRYPEPGRSFLGGAKRLDLHAVYDLSIPAADIVGEMHEKNIGCPNRLKW